MGGCPCRRDELFLTVQPGYEYHLDHMVRVSEMNTTKKYGRDDSRE
jgi:hypothetical protein